MARSYFMNTLPERIGKLKITREFKKNEHFKEADVKVRVICDCGVEFFAIVKRLAHGKITACHKCSIVTNRKFQR